ncbi:hypothetical protein [Amycolatopsis sp. A1MSW2902]|uniref:hypothetical protein n=1 Tax=Amycolatopsis sp. A1MSW2902 TaxID=687413 RepID=UPI00307DD99E
MDADIHPSELERVTPDSVRAVLGAARVAYSRVFTRRPGVVRIDVRAIRRSERRARQRAVLASLESQRDDELWLVRPAGVTYRWRWWATWITVRDAGLDWVDPATGLDYIAALAKKTPADS